MRKLLRADLCRMCKSRVLMLCMLSAFAVSLIFTLRFAMDTGAVKLVSWGSVMQTFPFMPILYAVFIGLFIGVEYQDRTLRNKLICGHSRLAVYFSLLVTVTLGCLAVIASWALGAAAGMIYNTEFIELPEALPLYIAAALLLTAAVAAVLTAAAMLIPNRAFSAVTAVLLAFGLILLGGAIYSALGEPETVSPVVINADGGFGVGEPQPNPLYISGTLREVYGYLMDVLPSGQALLLAGSALVHPALSLISSAAIMILVSALGAAVFRRKDLK